MSDIYSDSVYVQIKSPCKKRFPSPLTLTSMECLCPHKHTLKILCKSKHFPRTHKRKREWVFFSEHCVDYFEPYSTCCQLTDSVVIYPRMILTYFT